MNHHIRVTGFVAVLVTALLGGIVSAHAQDLGAMERGKSLYEGHCASCHGIGGDGTGLDAVGMTPAPTDFRSAGVMNGLTDNDLEQAILGGKPDTAMQGYGTVLSAEDLAALIAYLRSFSASP